MIAQSDYINMENYQMIVPAIRRKNNNLAVREKEFSAYKVSTFL